MKKNIVSDTLSKAGESIRNFQAAPMHSLGFLLPTALTAMALINGIVAYIIFIASGGYAAQVEATKEFGLFGGYGEKFTLGTTGLILSGFISLLLLILAAVELIILTVNFYKNSSKAKKVIMTIDLVVLVIQTVIDAVVFQIAVGNLIVSEDAFPMFGGLATYPQASYAICIFITLILLTVFLILIFTTENCRWMAGYTVASLLFAYVLIPVFFLFLENVIPLVTGIIALAIIALAAFIGYKIVRRVTQKDAPAPEGTSLDCE